MYEHGKSSSRWPRQTERETWSKRFSLFTFNRFYREKKCIAKKRNIKWNIVCTSIQITQPESKQPISCSHISKLISFVRFHLYYSFWSCVGAMVVAAVVAAREQQEFSIRLHGLQGDKKWFANFRLKIHGWHLSLSISQYFHL